MHGVRSGASLKHAEPVHSDLLLPVTLLVPTVSQLPHTKPPASDPSFEMHEHKGGIPAQTRTGSGALTKHI